ncbi:MAG: histidine kinase [Treponema sp.]|jgi:two-component system sensor histidine kinase YesM|nr:histidine kinase [Treponema sp.]
MILKTGDSWNSLNGRLKFCGFIAVAGIAAVTGFSLIASWRSAYKDVYSYFHRIEAEMNSALNARLEEIQTITRNAGYSVPVQRFFLSSNPEIVIMNYNTALENITGELNSSKYCKNIYIASAGSRYLRASRYRVNEIREGIAKNREGVELSHPILETRPNDEGLNELYFYLPVYNILWIEKTSKLICVAICDMSGITLLPSFAEENSAKREDTVLLLYKDQVVSSSRPVPAEEQKAIAAAVPGQSRIKINGKNHLVIKVSLPETLTGNPANKTELFWDCIYYIPEGEVFSRIFSQINKGLLILSGVVIFIAAILMVLIHSMNNGISRMIEDLNILDYSRRLSVGEPRLKELALISHSINIMLDRINQAVRMEQEANEKLFATVTAQAQAEFMSYRTQISPHFLFNTLECMRAMARSSGNNHLETLISSMSWMFRYSIHAKPMVSLSLEIEHLSNYMKVMNIRSGGIYTLRTRISVAAAQRSIPSMILQPLAENSLTHGFAGSDRRNCVMLLDASCDEEDKEPLRLRFVDNGLGIREETLEDILRELDNDRGTAHALQNIYRRMKLCFGGSFNFSMRSKYGHYTVIEMLIPPETELAIPEIK